MADNDNQYNFLSPKGKNLNLEDVVREIVYFVNAKPREDFKYRIIIASDSDAHEGKGVIVPFSTAVILHRIGHGGIFFVHRTKRENVYSMKERIYFETILSITLAQELRDRLKNFIDEDYLLSENFVIDADVGERGKTREIVREIVGMVKGNGFSIRIKPDAPGIYVADKYVKPVQSPRVVFGAA